MLFKFNEKIGNFFNWEDWLFTCEKKENITKPLITMTRWKKAYLIFFQNILQSGVFCKKISLTVLEPVKNTFLKTLSKRVKSTVPNYAKMNITLIGKSQVLSLVIYLFSSGPCW